MSRPCLAGALAVFMALGPTGCAGGTTEDTPSPSMVPIADCVSADEQRNGEVHVPATAGGSITAVVLGSGNTGVLLANMNRGDFCQWRPFADHLLQHGYRVLMFNYSADSPTVDVTATADVLRRKGAEHLFLIGASMGGTAALDAAAHLQPPVAGVVSLSAPQTYLGSDALKAMPLLTVPVMFIAAGNDQPFTDDARLLHDACAAKDKTLSYEPGSSHGTALLSEDVRRRIDAFLSGH